MGKGGPESDRQDTDSDSGKGQGGLKAILQVEELAWLVEREAVRTIRRWQENSAEEGGGGTGHTMSSGATGIKHTPTKTPP